MRRSARAGGWTERAPPPSPRSAGASTACRSRSSWPPPARRFLTPSALLARLGRRLDLLVAGPPDVPARHRTLRATIEWSYQLLSPAEQQLFAQLGVFVGGCELEAAEAVCSDSDRRARDARRTCRPQSRAARGRLEHPHRDAGDAARVRRRAARVERRGGERAGDVTQRGTSTWAERAEADWSAAAGRLASPARGRSRQSGRRAGVARTGRGRTAAAAPCLRALALLAHQRLRRGGEAVAYLRDLGAGHVTADRPCQGVTTRGELRPNATRRGRRQSRLAAEALAVARTTKDVPHAGGRPRDGRQRELSGRATSSAPTRSTRSCWRSRPRLASSVVARTQ